MESGKYLPDQMTIEELMDLDIPNGLRLHSLQYEDDIKTVGDIRRASDKRLVRIPNFGATSLSRIREFLGKHQFLNPAPPPDLPSIIIELQNRIEILERRVDSLATDSEGFLVA